MDTAKEMVLAVPIDDDMRMWIARRARDADRSMGREALQILKAAKAAEDAAETPTCSAE